MRSALLPGEFPSRTIEAPGLENTASLSSLIYIAGDGRQAADRFLPIFHCTIADENINVPGSQGQFTGLCLKAAASDPGGQSW
jgi:hypothetical protein